MTHIGTRFGERLCGAMDGAMVAAGRATCRACLDTARDWPALVWTAEQARAAGEMMAQMGLVGPGGGVR